MGLNSGAVKLDAPNSSGRSQPCDMFSNALQD
jgi:hypothetical protein